MVLPPYVHAGWSGARRLAGGGGDRLRVCETNVSLETVVWTAQKPLTFPETVPETVVKPNVFSETVAFLFEVHIEFLTLIRTPRSPRKSWVLQQSPERSPGNAWFFQAVHATVSEKTAAFTATQAVTAQCLENAIWEEADYLAVCRMSWAVKMPLSTPATPRFNVAAAGAPNWEEVSRFERETVRRCDFNFSNQH